MYGVELIATLSASLTAALVLGYLTQRLGLSPIVGYLLGGILVGPSTPGFVANVALAEQLAEIGVILLMFGVGLQFHLDELLSVRRVALPGAVAQSAVATGMGALVTRAFGWDWQAGIVFGMALSVASTVVLVRILSDNRELHTETGHIAVGWLVVEDLLTVVLLVLLPAFVRSGSTADAIGWSVVWSALKVTVLVTFTLFAGKRALPWLLDRVAATRSRELFTLTVLVIALGIAVSFSAIFGVSMALGAFLAGMVVGRSEYSSRAASEALPMRDAFAVLFFVSVGMLLDPKFLFEAPGLIAAAAAVVVLGKPLVAGIVVRLLGYPFKAALAVGIALAQIGEFSFILAARGQDLGVLDREAMNTVVAVAILSIVVSPMLYRLVGPLERWTASRRKRSRPGEAPGIPVPGAGPAADEAHRGVVIGYGPTGRTLTRLLRENGIEPTVIELNRDAVRELQQKGVAAVYGDASRRETLESAGVARASNLFLTGELPAGQEVIRLARELNRDIRVLARAADLREARVLRAAGAQDVFSGEGEVALALIEATLHRLGATPEQIDRERSRVHSELFGES
jgi:CPA2 family monovalent cation:H+ antiporter-2